MNEDILGLKTEIETATRLNLTWFTALIEILKEKQIITDADLMKISSKVMTQTAKELETK